MEWFRKKPKAPKVAAVVAAAGSSSRMEGIDKQRALLEELPVLVRSIAALSECPLVEEIVLVCPPRLIPDYYAMVQDYRLDKVASVVGGGATRQESVFLGVAACGEDSAYFAVHDGARPLVSPQAVERCISAAVEHGAAALGVPVKDTLKRLDENGFVVATPPREDLVAIQTPQVFEANLYRRAMAQARHDGRDYTDDCQLVERAGMRVKVVPGSYGNIKITTPEDLALAGALLRLQEEGVSPWPDYA